MAAGSSMLDCGAELISLQKGLRPEDANVLTQTPAIRRFENELSDFAQTAALISHLDLVISVDTAMAHLAGALGKPLWLLLPQVPDWRWLLDRNDSPWYPTAKLFRQEQAGDWSGVIERVGSLLSIQAGTPR